MPSGSFTSARFAKWLAPVLTCVLVGACSIDTLDAVGKECTTRCPSGLACVNGKCERAAGGASAGSIVGLSAGNVHMCAWRKDGRTKCWGNNGSGQLGIGDKVDRGSGPNQMGNALPFVDLGKDLVVTVIVAGRTHTCALFDGGRVKCWGSNFGGQLGLGDKNARGDEPNEMGDALPFVDLGSGQVATAIAAGDSHSCALLEGGRVKCWGGDHGDEPGEMGDALPFVELGTDRTARAITAGEYHVCALLDTGAVKCWGNNKYAQLGRGDVTDPIETGDALPNVDLGSGHTALAIVAGDVSTCAILEDRTVKCWGDNQYGQLGLGDINHRGDQPGEMGSNLPAVDVGHNHIAKSIHLSTHTCALLDFDAVRCWGYNNSGQLGVGDTNNHGGQPGDVGDALRLVDLGVGRSAKTVAPAGWHTCALLDISRVKCWGQNFFGQLGLGDTLNRGDNPDEMGDALPFVDLGN